MPESCSYDPAMGYSPADPTSTQLGSIYLVTPCMLLAILAYRIRHFHHCKRLARNACQTRIVQQRQLNHQGGSDYSGRSDRHSVSSCPDVPMVLGGCSHSSSGIAAIPNGTFVTPNGASMATPTSIPVVSVGHGLPNSTVRSSGGGSNSIESNI